MLARRFVTMLAMLFLFHGVDTARADSPIRFIRAQCLSQIGRFSLETFLDWNRNPDAALAAQEGVYALEAFLNVYRAHPLTCDLGAGIIVSVSVQQVAYDKLGAPVLRLTVSTPTFTISQLHSGPPDTDFYVVRDDLSRLNELDQIRWEECELDRETPLDWPTSIHCRRGAARSDGQRDRPVQELEFLPSPGAP